MCIWRMHWICKRKGKRIPLHNGVNISQVKLLLNYTSRTAVFKITISLQILFFSHLFPYLRSPLFWQTRRVRLIFSVHTKVWNDLMVVVKSYLNPSLLILKLKWPDRKRDPQGRVTTYYDTTRENWWSRNYVE